MYFTETLKLQSLVVPPCERMELKELELPQECAVREMTEDLGASRRGTCLLKKPSCQMTLQERLELGLQWADTVSV